jgi:23S rRNA pseudouridine1911/1915/1917 synthase
MNIQNYVFNLEQEIAKTIGFVHPTSQKYMEFTSELPECFLNILNIFENDIEK